MFISIDDSEKKREVIKRRRMRVSVEIRKKNGGHTEKGELGNEVEGGNKREGKGMKEGGGGAREGGREAKKETQEKAKKE